MNFLKTLKPLAAASWKDAWLLIAVSFTIIFFIATSFVSAVYLTYASAVPFYLILKQLVSPKAIWPLLIAYLFYPFPVGHGPRTLQNYFRKERRAGLQKDLRV